MLLLFFISLPCILAASEARLLDVAADVSAVASPVVGIIAPTTKSLDGPRRSFP